MLYNRVALCLCSSVALTLGQHLNLAMDLFVVAESACFRGIQTITLQLVFSLTVNQCLVHSHH